MYWLNTSSTHCGYPVHGGRREKNLEDVPWYYSLLGQDPNPECDAFIGHFTVILLTKTLNSSMRMLRRIAYPFWSVSIIVGEMMCFHVIVNRKLKHTN